MYSTLPYLTLPYLPKVYLTLPSPLHYTQDRVRLRLVSYLAVKPGFQKR